MTATIYKIYDIDNPNNFYIGYTYRNNINDKYKYYYEKYYRYLIEPKIISYHPIFNILCKNVDFIILEKIKTNDIKKIKNIIYNYKYDRVSF